MLNKFYNWLVFSDWHYLWIDDGRVLAWIEIIKEELERVTEIWLSGIRRR